MSIVWSLLCLLYWMVQYKPLALHMTSRLFRSLKNFVCYAALYFPFSNYNGEYCIVWVILFGYLFAKVWHTLCFIKVLTWIWYISSYLLNTWFIQMNMTHIYFIFSIETILIRKTAERWFWIPFPNGKNWITRISRHSLNNIALTELHL